MKKEGARGIPLRPFDPFSALFVYIIAETKDGKLMTKASASVRVYLFRADGFLRCGRSPSEDFNDPCRNASAHRNAADEDREIRVLARKHLLVQKLDKISRKMLKFQDMSSLAFVSL